MNKRAVGFTLMALSLGLLLATERRGGRANAAEGDDIPDGVKKIAGLIKDGKTDAAKSAAAALAKKNDMDDLMEVFKPRNKKGLGVGKVAGKVIPDGIELKLLDLGRNVPAAGTLAKEAEALEDMSYNVAAMAEIAMAKGPPKDKLKNKKDWDSFAKEMRDASAAFRKAVNAKGGQEVKTQATKLNNACAGCHSQFKG